MIRLGLIGLGIMSLMGLIDLLQPFPAQAAPCRTVANQTHCVEQVQRSAKNYWEYRVTLRINGVLQPVQIYDCRDRTLLQKDGTRTKFGATDIGQTICRLYKA
jgi:hypothetical protein